MENGTVMMGSNRILVVDDEDGLRTSLAANLEIEGYEVFEAADGRRAVESVRERRYDLVLTDVQMPELDGLDAFREIHRIQPDVVVVMMTGFTLEVRLGEALGEGVYTVVHKPFSMEHLIRLIRRALARRIILVVDDAVEQAVPLVEALRSLGQRAEAAHDGPSAVASIHRGSVDVCVLDLVMPGMDGVQVYEEILRLDPTISVIAVSGHAVPEMMHRVMTLGGYACLRKPFEVPELVRAIARARGEARR